MLGNKYINRIFKKTTIIYLLFISLNIYAETSIIQLNGGQVVSGVKSFEKKLPNSELTLLNLTIGLSKLEDVKSKLKRSEIYHEGDAGNSLYVLCYKGPDGTIVSFESSEMGGKGHIITAIGIFSVQSSYRLQKNCLESTEVNSKLNIAGVNLGQSKSEIKKRKGSPSKEISNLMIYQFDVTEKTTKNVSVDVSSRIEITLRSNKVVSFYISKIESY